MREERRRGRQIEEDKSVWKWRSEKKKEKVRKSKVERTREQALKSCLEGRAMGFYDRIYGQFYN